MISRDQLMTRATALNHCHTPSVFFSELERFAEEMGFFQLLYTAIPSFYSPSVNTLPPVFHTTYDTNWMEYYASRRYDLQDTALKHCLSGAETAFIWPRSFNLKRLKPVERRIFLEACDAGLKHGFTLPMRNSFGACGVMSLAFEGSEQEFEAFYSEVKQFTALYCYHFNESILNKTAHLFGGLTYPNSQQKNLKLSSGWPTDIPMIKWPID